MTLVVPAAAVATEPSVLPGAIAEPPTTPHFRAPFRFVSAPDGTVRADVVEQDTIDEVLSCSWNVVVCPVGFRAELPTFGIRPPEFAQAPIDPGDIVLAVQSWEPRAEINSQEFADTATDAWRHILLTESLSPGVVVEEP